MKNVIGHAVQVVLPGDAANVSTAHAAHAVIVLVPSALYAFWAALNRPVGHCVHALGEGAMSQNCPARQLPAALHSGSAASRRRLVYQDP